MIDIRPRRKELLNKINSLMAQHNIKSSLVNERIKYPITRYGWKIEELTDTNGEGYSLEDLYLILMIVEKLADE